MSAESKPGCGTGGLDALIGPQLATAAGIYDFFLGGKDHMAADRAAAAEIEGHVPDAALILRENRAFLGRAVRTLAGMGVRQFLDIGAGLPTCDPVHKIAQRTNPAACTVYVDSNPVVVRHAQALLATNEHTDAIEGNLRDPRAILDHPIVEQAFDLDEPVAVLLAAVMHFVPGEEAYATTEILRDWMRRGYLVLSHVDNREELRAAATVYDDGVDQQATTRDLRQVRRFFDGFEMLPPDLVQVSAWRPDAIVHRDVPFWGGVGRK